jgi:hypothetical protein
LALIGTASADEASVGIKVHKQSDIKYVTGGSTDEEVKNFATIANKYPVQIMFMVDGKHVAETKDVKVKVIDVRGDVLVEAMSEGPLFYVSPPSGRWTFDAEWKGQKQSQTKDLTGRRYLVLEFNFNNP